MFIASGGLIKTLAVRRSGKEVHHHQSRPFPLLRTAPEEFSRPAINIAHLRCEEPFTASKKSEQNRLA